MFCEKCGSQIKHNECLFCGYKKYINSIPVAVAIIPVLAQDKIQILAVRRNISPNKGELALPGGFQEVENIIECLKREVQEECKIIVEIDNNYNQLVLSSHPIPNRTLIFFVCKMIEMSKIDFTIQNEETTELCLIEEHTSLAFPLHEQAVKWFIDEYNKQLRL